MLGGGKGGCACLCWFVAVRGADRCGDLLCVCAGLVAHVCKPDRERQLARIGPKQLRIKQGARLAANKHSLLGKHSISNSVPLFQGIDHEKLGSLLRPEQNFDGK